jgi:hypothetical protein
MSKKKRHEKTLVETIYELFESVDSDLPPQSSSSSPPPSSTNQVQILVTKLKAVIDDLAKNFANAKDLVLELARVLDETKQCKERSRICRKIKEMLKEKIAEGKITAKWIEECLPREYRRRYNNSIKSELSSLSGSEDEQEEEDGDDNDDAKKVEQIIIYTSGRSSTVKEELLSLSSPHHSSGNSTSNHGTNDSECNSITIKPNKNSTENASETQDARSSFEGDCRQLEEEDDCDGDIILGDSSVIVRANKIHYIHKEKYDLLRQAMNSSKQFCFITFDKDGTLVRAESDISKQGSNKS